jgi:hypothetical protein
VDQHAVAEYRYRAVPEVLWDSPIGEVAAGSQSASRQECAVCSAARQPPSKDGFYWCSEGSRLALAGSCRTYRDLAAFLGSPG